MYIYTISLSLYIYIKIYIYPYIYIYIYTLGGGTTAPFPEISQLLTMVTLTPSQCLVLVIARLFICLCCIVHTHHLKVSTRPR